MPSWTLPRSNDSGVKGVSYIGVLKEVAGIKLNNEILVLGFNHNIQSSFGVTKEVKTAIKTWVARKYREMT